MTTGIRVSMLPSYPDCPRRGGAKQFKKEIDAAGFELRQLDPSVGAAVGTAVHAAAAYVLQHQIDHGEVGGLERGLEIAIDSFNEEVVTGAIWDDTTPNRQVAEKQIARITKTYITDLAPGLDPAMVECHFKADAGDDFEISGHLDLITRLPRIRDLKTGALVRPYQAQLGGYSLLARSQPEPIAPKSICIDFIKRTPHTKAQDAPITTEYDMVSSERAAFNLIGNIKRDLMDFRKRYAAGTPHPEEAFPANPMSMLCTDKYCPAWGSDWCAMGRA